MRRDNRNILCDRVMARDADFDVSAQTGSAMRVSSDWSNICRMPASAGLPNDAEVLETGVGTGDSCLDAHCECGLDVNDSGAV